MPQLQQNRHLIRGRILGAARERFTRYGFGKTTMAEIAMDCGMSASNLYRFFDNKHEIGAAMARQCLGDKASALEQVVDEPGISGPEKIRHFILTSLRYTHHRWSSQPHMSELVDAITGTRRDLVGRHLARTRGLLKRIIDEGVAAGEFDVDDSRGTAEAVMAAMFIFDYPNMMKSYPLEVLEQKAVMVADLIVHGLEKS